MTTAQVVETSVTVNNNSPIQDYVHPDDQTQPTFDIYCEIEVKPHSTLNSYFSFALTRCKFLNIIYLHKRFFHLLKKNEDSFICYY